MNRNRKKLEKKKRQTVRVRKLTAEQLSQITGGLGGPGWGCCDSQRTNVHSCHGGLSEI